MKLSFIKWFLIGCCLAIAGFFLLRQSPTQREQGNASLDTGLAADNESPGVRARHRALVEPARREVESGRADDADVVNQGVHPVRERVTEMRARSEANAASVSADSIHRAQVSNDKPESGAEVLSLHPNLQELKRTNFVAALEQLRNAKSEHDRYLALDSAAKLAFLFGKTEDARVYANELLALDQKFRREPWRGGDAMHDGNLVLGKIALQEGRIDDAKQHLLNAGTTKGSPVLGSFGPNMTLARDLLQNGGQETVIEYFEACKNFWDKKKLDEWIDAVKAGRTPDFGPNLIY